MTDLECKQCPICGIHYAVDRVVMDYKRECPTTDKDRGWYCPNGHSLVFRESDADRFRQERDRARQEIARMEEALREEQDRTAAAERTAAAYKGQTTKLRKRVAAGVCPCCNRSFANLHRHMQTKHPDFTSEPLRLVAGEKT